MNTRSVGSWWSGHDPTRERADLLRSAARQPPRPTGIIATTRERADLLRSATRQPPHPASNRKICHWPAKPLSPARSRLRWLRAPSSSSSPGPVSPWRPPVELTRAGRRECRADPRPPLTAGAVPPAWPSRTAQEPRHGLRCGRDDGSPRPPRRRGRPGPGRGLPRAVAEGARTSGAEALEGRRPRGRRGHHPGPERLDLESKGTNG